MTVKLRGLFGPMVTTFDRRGELDLDAFTVNLRAHLDVGLDGVVVAGSTGEAALLDETERATLIETARKLVPSDKLLLAGTGAESTRTCIRLTKQAAERGVDAVLVVAPHYYAPVMSFEALSCHYRAVADASPVPVVLYNIPKYMHFSLAPALVTDLAGHPNIIGIKDSSGNLDLLSAYMNAPSQHFNVLTGSGSTLKEAVEDGARGGVLAVALFAPQLAVSVFQAMQSGKKQEAEALQKRLTALNAKIVGDLGIGGIKVALELIGLRGGPLRSPLQPMTVAQRGEIAALMKEQGISLV